MLLSLLIVLMISGCGGGGGSGSGDSSSNDSTAPANVSDLTAQPDDEKVVLNWTPPPDIPGDLSGYNVYYSDDGGETYAPASSSLSKSIEQHEVTSLTNGQLYTFKVSTYDDSGNESTGVTTQCYANAVLDPSSVDLQHRLENMIIVKTLNGSVPNPSGSESTYAGHARLMVNETSFALEPSWSGEAWEFQFSFDLPSGSNTAWIEVYDNQDIPYAKSSTLNISLDVSLVSPPDLSAFPEVRLSISVTDPTQGNVHVQNLSPDNFLVRNAGSLMEDITVAETDDSYSLSFSDDTCGMRELAVSVFFADNPLYDGQSELTTYGRSYALLVGIEDYPGIVNDLDYCVDDVIDMRAALLAHPLWAEENITMLTNGAATKSAVLDEIARIAGIMNLWDCFLFHYSGHGSNSVFTEYLCTVDLYYVWISVEDLTTALETVPVPGNGLANVYVFLDSCYSSGFIKAKTAFDATPKYMPFDPRTDSPASIGTASRATFLARQLTGDNMCVITACDENQSSWDDVILENGVFTYFLVEGINGPSIQWTPANSDNDEWVTIEEAFDYLAPLVSAWVDGYNNEGETVYEDDPQFQDNNLDTLGRVLSSW